MNRVDKYCLEYSLIICSAECQMHNTQYMRTTQKSIAVMKTKSSFQKHYYANINKLSATRVCEFDVILQAWRETCARI